MVRRPPWSESTGDDRRAFDWLTEYEGPLYDSTIESLSELLAEARAAEREACIAAARKAVEPFEARLRAVIGRNAQLVGEQLSGARAVLRAVESRAE